MADQSFMIQVLNKYDVETIAAHYNIDQLRWLYIQLTGFEPTLKISDRRVLAAALKQTAKFMGETEDRRQASVSNLRFYLEGALNYWSVMPEDMRDSDDMITLKGLIKICLEMFDRNTQTTNQP